MHHRWIKKLSVLLMVFTMGFNQIGLKPIFAEEPQEEIQETTIVEETVEQQEVVLNEEETVVEETPESEVVEEPEVVKTEEVVEEPQEEIVEEQPQETVEEAEPTPEIVEEAEIVTAEEPVVNETVEEVVEQEPEEPVEEGQKEKIQMVIETQDPIVNPFFEELFGREEILKAYPDLPRASIEYVEVDPDLLLTPKTIGVYYDIETAAEYLANEMLSISPSVEISFNKLFEDTADISSCYNLIYNRACEIAGDYLNHTLVASRGKSYSYFPSYLNVQEQTITYPFEFVYAVSPAQEQELTSKINTILNNLNLWNKSDYEKVKGVYEYVTRNVVYDYDGLNAASGLGFSEMTPQQRLTWTAYKALLQGTSVCQGYALAMCRLLEPLGIECHYISGDSNGESHGWNIVKVDGTFYYIDATWDADPNASINDCDYFLKGTNDFPDHTISDEDAAKYTISPTNYVIPSGSQPTVAAQGITVDPTYDAIEVGKSLQLSWTFTPENTTNQKVTFTSSNTSVATVNTNGLVTGKAVGETTITARTSNGKTTTVLVRVLAVGTIFTLATGISIQESSVNLEASGTSQLHATVTPNNATEKRVTWSSDDESIATVDSNGKVTAVGNGSTTIRAKTIDTTELEASVPVTVTVMPTSVTVTPSSRTIYSGNYLQLSANVQPSTAGDHTVTWSSSNTSVATVSNGLVQATNTIGSASKSVTITARSNAKNSVYGSSTITVRQAVNTISFSSSSINAAIGRTVDLTQYYTIAPSYAYDKNINWTSGDTSIATVNSSGIVTPVGEGTTTIYASARDGQGASAQVQIRVFYPVSGIEVSETELNVNENDTLDLNSYFTVLPEEAENKNVNFTSSDTSVAEVYATGIVTAKKAGDTTITITSQEDSSISATITIHVLKPVTGVSIEGDKTRIRIGKTLNLNAKITPSDASNQNVTWTSSDPDIASVDENGVVTGLDLGSTQITVTTEDGGYSAYYDLEVTDINYFTLTFHTGEGSINYNYSTYTEDLELEFEEGVQIFNVPSATYKNDSKGFAGWYFDEACTLEAVFSEYEVDGNTDFYPLYVDYVNVTLDFNGGFYLLPLQDPTYQEEVRVLASGKHYPEFDATALQRTDGDFELSGWKDEDGNSYTSLNEIYPTKDMVLTAQWDEYYTVQLHTDKPDTYIGYKNGQAISSDSVRVKKGERLLNAYSPHADVYEEYFFDNWYEEPVNYGTPVYLYNYKPEGNTTLVAHFVKTTPITYDANGGYFNDPSITINEGYFCVFEDGQSTRTVNAINPIHNQYVFKGWGLSPDATKTVELYLLKPSEPITLYAIWSKPFLVTLDAGKGQFNDGSKTKVLKVAEGESISSAGYYTPTCEDAVLNGWYLSDTFEDEFLLTEGVYNYYPTEDITIYARFNDTVTYTFDGNGATYYGSTTWTTNVEVGRLFNGYIETPRQPDGLAFLGWYDNPEGTGEKETFIDHVVSEPKTYYAKWDEGYTITVHGNGGQTYRGETEIVRILPKNSIIQNQHVTYESEFSRNGYKVKGLYYDEACTQPVEQRTGFRITENLDYYVGWTQEFYTLTFDSNGGFPDFGPYQVIKGEPLNMSVSVSTREPKAFAGWYFDVDGRIINDIYGYVPTADTTITAQWTDDVYKVTFHSEDIELSNNLGRGYEITGYVKKGEPLGNHLVPNSYINNNNLKIDGWYLDSTYKNKVENIYTYVPTQDTDLYLRIVEKDEINLTVYLGEGYYEHYEYGKLHVYKSKFDRGTILGRTYHPEVYWKDDTKAFIGYSLTENGELINPLEYKLNEDTVLYAVYTDNVYTITFDLNGGSYDNKSKIEKTIRKGAYLSYYANPTHPNGLLFAGFFADPNDLSTRFESPIYPTEDMTYYARWEDEQCRIDYVVEDGVCIEYIDGYSYHTKNSAVYLPNAKNNAGKTFVGWYDNPEFTGNRYYSYNSFTITHDMTLYAKFADSIKVTFDANGKKFSDGKTKTVLEMKPGYSLNNYLTSIPKQQPNINFTIGQWNTKPDGSGQTVINSQQLWEDTTLYAIWQATPVPVASITVDPTTKTVKTGTQFGLTVTINPSDATDRRITWTSSDESIAIVNGGYVTTYKPGEVTITATSNNGKKATCVVTVTDEIINPTSITVDKKSVELNEGASIKVTATVLPNNASDKTVKWTSSNASIATVDANGTIKGIKEGTATITASTSNNKKATVTVKVNKVNKEIPVSSLSVTPASSNIKIGEKVQLKVTVLPNDATDKSVTYTSSNPNIATVDNKGNVTGISEGTITVSIVAKNGKKTSASVYVESLDLTIPKLTAVYNSVKGIDFRFKPYQGASSYDIWRKNRGVWTKIATVTPDQLEMDGGNYKFYDTEPKEQYGKIYIYSVAAHVGDKLTDYNQKGLGICRLAPPTLEEVRDEGGTNAYVQWSFGDKSTGYEVQFSNDLKFDMKTVTKTQVVGRNVLNTIVSGVPNGKQYFRVRSYMTDVNNITYYSQYTAVKSITKTGSFDEITDETPTDIDFLPMPELTAVYNSVKGIDFRFKPVDRATGYDIWRKNRGVWTKIDTVRAEQLEMDNGSYKYFDTEVKDLYGKIYIYSVAARAGTLVSEYNDKGRGISRLAPPALESISVSGNQIYVNWTLGDKSDAYEVQYAETLDFKDVTKVRVEGRHTLNTIINGLPKGKTYYFRIRSSVTDFNNLTYYSQYSKVKTIQY